MNIVIEAIGVSSRSTERNIDKFKQEEKKELARIKAVAGK